MWCRKVFIQKRKTFNVAAHRLEGTEAAKFVQQPKGGGYSSSYRCHVGPSGHGNGWIGLLVIPRRAALYAAMAQALTGQASAGVLPWTFACLSRWRRVLSCIPTASDCWALANLGSAHNCWNRSPLTGSNYT